MNRMALLGPVGMGSNNIQRLSEREHLTTD